MPISPQIKSLLDMVYRVGAPRFHELSPAQARRSFEKLHFAFRPPAPAVASTVEVPMGRSDGTVLLGRHYRPLQSAADEQLPLLIYLHGGGWCVGDVESHDVLCRELANRARCAVLSVDYRLAPEYPFPAALEDAMLAFDWVQSNGVELNIDVSRVAFGGDSAGGNLAIVTSLLLRDRNAALPVFLALVYPCTEIISRRPSRERFAEGYFLDKGSLEWFFGHYLPGGQVDDWRASPMLAESLSGLPPIFLVTAEFDPLTDDCTAFAERVRAEGGVVTEWCVAGMVHGFLTLGRLVPEAGLVVERLSVQLGRAFCVATARDGESTAEERG